MVDVVIRLWGLTKLIKRFWSFQRPLVFSIYCSRWLTAQISWSGYLKSTSGSRWCSLDLIVSNPEQKIVTLCALNTIKFMFILNKIWSLWQVVIHRRVARWYGRIFKSHCFKAWRLFICLRTTDTSHIVEYLGRTGCKLKNPKKSTIFYKSTF